MTKEDLIRKITSRKFWVAVVAFVTALLVAFNVPEASISQVAAILMAFGSLLAYIFAEGWVDATRENTSGSTYNWVTPTEVTDDSGTDSN